ncbi:hypothetical protein N9A11_01005 [bacterium]|nr:hypothetical protein [bacterium]
MWLFTSEGFISVVQHNEKPDALVVRARDEDSLLSLVEATGATLRHTPSNDYPYRIETSPGVLSSWLAEQVLNLDYTNYKAHMWSQRPEFGAALHDVWVAMHQVTPSRVTEADRQRAKELYPNQEMTDGDIEMAKALGHL